MTPIISRRDEDGVAILVWDDPDQTVNVKSAAAIGELSRLVADVLADDSVVGYVIASGKAGFVAGGDLDELRRCVSPEEVLALLRPVGAVLRQIETGRKPAVAAIGGPALGGGLELALACHRRVGSRTPKTLLGLPEITLGLMPGAGGTQRLPRLIGLERALPMMLEGKPADAEKALEYGLLDRLVDTDALLAAAAEMARSRIAPVQPWDVAGHQRTFDPQSPSGRRLFASTWPRVKQRCSEADIAADAIMMAVHHGLQRELDAGLAIEARHFARVASSPAARNVIRTSFYGFNEARRVQAHPKDAATGMMRAVAVVGAGLMGSGIGYAAAQAGLDVALLDRDEASARAGLASIERSTERAVASGRLSEDGRRQLLARITPGVVGDDLTHVDAVVEAVFEVETVKAEALRAISARTRPGIAIASNTSTIPISLLARHCARPSEFLGLHFFAPVDRMELVETIRGQETSPATLALALGLVRRMRKIPIVVGDGPGFFTSRVIAAYTGEALTLLAEGVNPVTVDGVALAFGMPIGPLAMADLTGIPVLTHIFASLRGGGKGGAGSRADEVLGKLASAGRTGKSQGGIYDRGVAGPSLWSGLTALFERAAASPPNEDIRRRLVFAQVLEAVRALEEGIVSSPIDGDIGSVLGWRFPLAYGGVFGFVDTLGAAMFVDQCRDLASRYGERFTPPALLVDMAARRQRFHAL